MKHQKDSEKRSVGSGKTRTKTDVVLVDPFKTMQPPELERYCKHRSGWTLYDWRYFVYVNAEQLRLYQDKKKDLNIS